MQETLKNLGNLHWYLKGNHLIFSLLIRKFLSIDDSKSKRKRLLDIGAGAGYLARMLIPYGDIFVTDISFEAMCNCRDHGLLSSFQSDACWLSLQDSCFDMVVALDVIEHIDTDDQVIREIARVLRPGGYAIVAAPAFNFLRGRHDIKYGHLRRYTKRQLTELIQAQNLILHKVSYLHPFLMPIMLVFRFFDRFNKNIEDSDDFKVPPSWINSLFFAILKLEAFFLLRFNFSFGISLVCVAQKKLVIDNR